MIILDFHSKTPIYEQIEEQVMLMVRRGVYKPHDRLPWRGVFISENAADNSRVREQALSALSTALRSAKANGLSEADIEELIKQVYAENK